MKTKKPLTSHEIRAIQSKIFEKTGVRLKKYLTEQAFTRSSYSKKYGGGSNENFEYIGDTILGYYVVKKLFCHYGTIHSDEHESIYTFRAHEKDFTALKSKIVSNRTLSEIMDEWDLCQYLIVAQSDIDSEIDKQEKIKADLFEAVVGAIAVQVNWNPKTMEEVVNKILPIDKLLSEYEKSQYRPVKFNLENAVTTLKEFAEQEKCSVPVYEITGPENLGYDSSGYPQWCCKCSVQTQGITKTVFSHSKKDAKKYSAYLVLCEMFGLTNEYGPSNRYSCWSFDGEHLTPDLISAN
jgi:ribonuclease-3